MKYTYHLQLEIRSYSRAMANANFDYDKHRYIRIDDIQESERKSSRCLSLTHLESLYTSTVIFILHR